MKFLQKTWVAVVITALVVLLSTTVNVNVNLGRKADAAEALWTAKYGPAEQLMVSASNASQLRTVIDNYDALQSESAALRAAYNAVYEANERQDIAGLYSANSALFSTANTAYATLQSRSDVSARDRENAACYYDLIVNAQRALDPSDYNAAVAEYQSLVSAFPLSLLRPLIRTEAPVSFGES